MSLFEERQPPKPLAERMRPASLDRVLGQPAAVAMLQAFVDQGEMPSLVFFGPPGSGKTSLSRLMAALLGWEGRILNATSASVKDIRELAVEAKEIWRQLEKRTLVFIDEIHRLNKNQQDVLLPIVEAGTFTLAGSTTENPFFSLNQALRSRVQLIRLEPLSPTIIKKGIKTALDLESWDADQDSLDWVADRVAGDLRLAYSVFEAAALLAKTRNKQIGREEVSLCLSQTQFAGDRQGDNHYDLASAFQKSLRGSDANAAVYYLARFLETGEDPRFIARRLLITASEDVGNADPMALVVASHCFRAVEVLGLPEARIALAQATLYVARAPKSNESICAVDAASAFLRSRPMDPIPAHLRDAHYAGAAELGHGKDYVYTHNHPDQRQFFLPDNILDQVFVPDLSAKKASTDEELETLLSKIKERFSGQDWFEIDMEDLSTDTGWPGPKLRAALNRLVQSGRLAFKRSFTFPESGDTRKVSQ